MMKKIYLPLICIFLYSCGDEGGNPLNLSTKADNQAAKEKAKLAVEEIAFFYPGESSRQGNILTIGNFHNDEIPDGAGKMEWMGLFKNEKGWYLEETGILINRVRDEIVDAENEQTGWQITTTNPDTCFILIEEFPGIQKKKVERILPDLTSLMPNQTLDFSFKGIKYQLMAKGQTIQQTDWVDVKNYELLLKATIGGADYIDTLVMIPSYNEKFTTILFVGDLDNDRIPDWIIDTSNHYNTEEITIYLSKDAHRPKLLQVHASHAVVGC